LELFLQNCLEKLTETSLSEKPWLELESRLFFNKTEQRDFSDENSPENSLEDAGWQQIASRSLCKNIVEQAELSKNVLMEAKMFLGGFEFLVLMEENSRENSGEYTPNLDEMEFQVNEILEVKENPYYFFLLNSISVGKNIQRKFRKLAK
jgi:hypothetical protein